MKPDKKPKARNDILICKTCRTQYKVRDAKQEAKINNECLRCGGTLLPEEDLMALVGDNKIEKKRLVHRDPLPGQMDFFEARDGLMREAERKIKRSGFKKEEEEKKND